MADDTPPRAEHELPSAVPQRKVVGGSVMPRSEDCRCDGDEDRLPYRVAIRAIQSGTVRAEAMLEFRREVDKIACRYHDLVPYSALYGLLYDFAYRAIWGRGFSWTLMDDVAADVGRELGFPPHQEASELIEVCTSLVAQATGRLLPDFVAYDPCEGKDPKRPPSMRGFVKLRAKKRMLRILKRDQRNLPVEDLASPVRDATGRGGGIRVEDLRRVSEPRSGEGEIRVALLQRAIGEAGALVKLARTAETLLLDLLEDMYAGMRATPKQRETRGMALVALRRALRGEPGHCLILDCRIGAPGDCEPLILATQISSSVAEARYGSRNATVLTKQVGDWIDGLLDAVAGDPRAEQARVFVRSALENRALAHSLLQALTDILASLDGAIAAELVALWLGPPHRDRTDGANGQGDVGGVGIAHVPFLFGLLNPLENANGLPRLIL